MAKHNRHYPKPDETYNLGPLSLTRYGKFVQFQNNMTSSQFDALQKHLAKMHDPVVENIDSKVSEIISLVACYDPVDLLTRGFYRHIKETINNQKSQESKTEGAQRLVDYVQSIIVSTPPVQPYQKLSEDVYDHLSSLILDVFDMIVKQFMITESAHRKSIGQTKDDERDFLIAHAQLHWCYVRGRRYQVHEIPLLKMLLTPQSDLLLSTLGVTADHIIDNLGRIQKSMTFGPFNAFKALREFQDTTMTEIIRRSDANPDFESIAPHEQMNIILADNKWDTWAEECINNIFGPGLMCIDKYCNLPESLLSELSYSPGEDNTFCAPGEYAGWPFRPWPVFSRPFLSYDGHYYCFDLHILFDNIYRNIYRSLMRLSEDPERTRQEWNNIQKNVTETIPLDLLLKLMPGATVYHGVFYKLPADETVPSRWCEVDGIVVFLDCIFIVEVKAGSLTPTPPMQDPAEYLQSIGNLIEKPAKQGGRFLSYLESKELVDICDSEHRQIASLKNNSFSQKVIMAVTLDGFTHISANVQDLNEVGLKLGGHPLWSISIDDLLVYSESFDNPLIFLHFVRMRMEAFKHHDMTAIDELDHLGLYLEFNNYSSVAGEFSPKSNIMWNGYTDRIDELFSKKLQDSSSSTILYQKMPRHLFDIVQWLGGAASGNRSIAARRLLDAEEKIRRQTEESVSNWLTGKPGLEGKGLIHIIGGCRFSTLCNWGGISNEERIRGAVEKTKAVMLKNREEDRCLICLTYTRQHELLNVSSILLNDSEIMPAERSHLAEFSQQEGIRRVTQHLAEHGSIGRNELCPCGSGFKYKKCCLRK